MIETHKLPEKLTPSDIEWGVIVFHPRPEHYCAICHARGCMWDASTKDKRGVPLCFACGDSKGKH